METIFKDFLEVRGLRSRGFQLLLHELQQLRAQNFVYAVTNFWLCTINDLFRVIIFASIVNFTVCAICCDLDSQITPTTEDLQASTN